MSWIKDLWDILKGNRPNPLEVTKVYIEAIEYLKAELKELKEQIAQYKKNHPENGKELDQWLEREEENHRRIIELLQQNRDLREENIFLKRAKK